MPGRIIPLINNEVYHVFNRGIASQPIFLDKRQYDRALETIFYYQNVNPPIRYSKFLKLKKEERALILNSLKKQKNFIVEIIALCLMPNHFHLLLKQVRNNGISKFVGNFSNSYTRYHNIKTERSGPLLEGKFKAVRIETTEQLLHVSRYIHLNPYTSFIVRRLEDLENYPYSSLKEYLNKQGPDCFPKDIILSNFKKIKDYKKFVFDQANYQRVLDQIKHLTLEEEFQTEKNRKWIKKPKV